MPVSVYRTLLSTPLGTNYAGQASAFTGVARDSTNTPIPLYDQYGIALNTTVIQHFELGVNSGVYAAWVYVPKGVSGVVTYTWTGYPSILALGTDFLAEAAVPDTAVINNSTILYTLLDNNVVLVSNMPGETELSVARGTDFPTLQFFISNSDNTPADLTGYDAIFMVKDNYDSPDTSPHLLIHKDTRTVGGMTIPNPLTGIIQSPILAADTAEALPYVKFPLNKVRFFSVKLFKNSIRIPGPWGKFHVNPFGVATNTTPP